MPKNDASDEVREHNQRLGKVIGLLNKTEFSSCLVSELCNKSAIQAHSVSQSILKAIQDSGKVVTPKISYSHEGEFGRLKSDVEFELEGVGIASSAAFACHPHDAKFNPIDTSPINHQDHQVLCLLFYRSILKELHTLSRLQSANAAIKKAVGPDLQLPPSLRPELRKKALTELKRLVDQCLESPNNNDDACSIVHTVRFINTERPVVAASCAQGESKVLVDSETGEQVAAVLDVPDWLVGEEGNISWGLTVIPEQAKHIVVASTLRGSEFEGYFAGANGKDLEEMVSVELIRFCENWFLHPLVWKAYGMKKQQAIVAAYANLEDLAQGQYSWPEPGEKEWYRHSQVTNRHQLNLFRYDERAFAS